MPTPNTLYYGDNLDILRSRSYNVLFKDESGRQSEAQITAFEDTWHWGPTAEATYLGLVADAPDRVSETIGALRKIVGANEMMAYLVMMAARLVELHRVLKPTGSLYLRCYPTASHYLKVILDSIFGAVNFRNEITWKRMTTHSDAKRWPPVSDTILYYAKTTEFQ